MKGLNLFRKDTRSRITALALAAVMALSGIPSIPAQAEENNTTVVATVADPETLHRPIDIYGQNTLNGGKITVGKSVSTEGFKENLLDGVSTGGLAPADNNFLVTLSQSAQAVGLASKMPVPVDAVFVLDTSGSMAKPENDPRYINMISAANEAIASLLAANDQNRIAVVAFSSEDYGRGTSDDAAANVLSDLAHYDGAAATAHLQRVNEYGQTNSSGTFVAGRSTVTNATIEVQWGNSTTNRSYSGNAFRKAQEGGTNIQAGIALGAEILMNVAAADTKVLIEGEQVTRMPFIIVLSDGAPTFSSTAADWYDADAIADADEQGPGSAPYAGNGFLAAMTAAYYKGKITEYYYGDNASEDNRCNIYTVGVDVNTASDMTASEVALAEMTLNPAQRFTNSNSWYNSFSSYWSSYNAANVRAFNIDVGEQYQDGRVTKYRSKYFEINADSITNSRNYVNGKNKDGISMYAGGMGYNDEYFATSGSSEALNNTFKELVRLIQIKAISLPTDTTVSADFGGYVHFYDPIGEYMEVKDVHGIVADGYFFRGASFAKNMVNFGTGANDAFDAAITEALNGRLELSESGKLDEADIKAIVDAAVQADGQLYYNDNSDYGNSFCWWGNSYTNSTTGDEHVQFLGFAEDDSIDYIESATAPNDADYVCRSYYYYGTAGGTIEPIDDFLLMAIRVQRSLVAPYQETVYVSIPGNLLSVDRVLITEDHTQNPVTYESFVQAENPVRIIYEVGLQSDINAQNVAQKLAGSAYVAEDTLDDSQGSKDNYEAEENTYYFYTNDWDRTKSVSSHERALAHAGFDVAEDNDFYAFLEDTLLYTDTNGTPATSMTTGETYYYKRPYYAWNDNGAKNEEKTLFACTLEEEYIAVVAPSQDVISKFAAQDASGQWYVKAGTYTAYSLSAENDDTIKVDANDNPANYTGTSTIVAHPMRTNAEHDSHYTVFLGNNGRLALKADKTKDVTITRLDDASNSGAVITDADGKLITVDDVLTYTIKVVNNEGAAANAVVTDSVPYGTELVEGSISFDANGTGATASNSNSNGAITWNIQNIPVNGTVYVSFQTKVTTAALDQNAITVDNQATVQIGNNPAYTTNKVENPPYGKLVEGVGTVNPDNGVKVGDELTYRINYYNDLDTAATITVEDIIPTGTTYVAGSATHNGTFANGVLTWTLANVDAGASGYVSFRVVVNESAKTPVENGAIITIGNNSYTTNTTGTSVLTGDLVLSKIVDVVGNVTELEEAAQQTKHTFTLKLTTASGLNGTYNYYKNSSSDAAGTVAFTNGVATVEIKHGEILTIKELPAGVRITVTEENVPGGYAPTYNPGQTVSVAPSGEGVTAVSVGVTNTYSVKPMKFQLKGTKNLSTAEGAFLKNTTFSIVAYNATIDNGNWVQGSLGTSAEPTVGTNNPTASALFGEKEITKAGTYRFIIRELNNNVSGVTYDETQYRLTLVIVDKDGQLEVDFANSSLVKIPVNASEVPLEFNDLGDLETNIVFNNSYAPKEVELELSGTKTLTGRTLQANKYSFIVQEIVTTNSVEALGEVVTTGTNIDTEGNIKFGGITYTKAGVYKYQITETNGGEDGITYDGSVYRLEVVVSDNNGKLEITSQTLTKDGATATNIVFANSYVPEEVGLILYAKKILQDKDSQALALTAGAFRFQIREKYTDGTLSDVLAYASNDADGKIEFPIIYFDRSDVGEHTLVISEIIPDLAASSTMKYDENQIEVVVVVTYDEGNGLLSVEEKTTEGYTNKHATDSNNTTVAFTNIDYPDFITVQPVAYKITNGTNLPQEAKFSFSVINAQTNTVMYTGSVSANNASQLVEFTELEYERAGEWDYWIVESNASNTTNGITYDTTRYRMNVKITLTDGQLSKEVSYFKLDADKDASVITNYTTPISESDVTFKNTYEAKGFINITAKKSLNGRELNAGEFTFELKRLGKLNVTEVGGELVPVISSKPGESEVTGATGEVTGTNQAGSDATINFATLYYSNGDFEENVNTAYILYEMSEAIPTINKVSGVTYDTNKYYVVIKLTHTSAEADVTASIYEVYKADGTKITTGSGNDTGIVFENSYSDGNTIVIPATKNLTGRDLREGEFTFGLYRVLRNGESVTYELRDSAKNAADDNNDGIADVTFSRFISATAPAGTYEYVIREEVGNEKGITYNVGEKKEYTVYVTVSYEADGTQNVYLSDANGNSVNKDNLGIVFENKYAATSTKYTPVATKTLNGRPMKDNEFSFTVWSMKEENGEYTKTQDVASTGLSKAAADGVASSIVFTPIIYNDRPGADNEVALYYVIEENHGAAGGVDYTKATPIYLKVVVKDYSEKGKIEVVSSTYYSNATFTTEAELNETANFTNTYKALGTTVKLEATKTLTGRDMEVAEFDIVLREVLSNGSIGTEIKLVGDNVAATAGTAATVNFAEIGYSEANTYTYMMSELAPPSGNINGITFDTVMYKVVVDVVDDGNGNLVPTVKYYELAEGVTDVTNPANYTKELINGVPSFHNTYAPEQTDVVKIDVFKNLIDKELKAEEFTFVLKDNADNVADSVKNGLTNQPLNQASFELTFNAPGKYTYTISEKSEANSEVKGSGTYTFDETVYTIVIDVTDNGKGKLEYTTTYYKGSVDDVNKVTLIDFTNNYTPSSIKKDLTATINATKTVTSPNGYTLEAGEFQFVVKDVTGNTVATGENEADGKIKFTDFTFTQPGEYRYWISEVVDTTKEAYMTYDARSWEVHVTVSYAYDDILVENSSEVLYPAGTLYIADGAVKTYASSRALETEAPAFVNIYTPAPVSLTITADKKLTVPEGSERKLQAHEFTFRVKDEHGIIRAESHNDAEGNITFNFTETVPGKHTYTVVEYVPAVNANGIYYDKETKATIEVTVVDDGSGQLKIENAASITKENVAVFTNTYNLTAATTTISAKKVLHGAELTAGAFKFELVDRTLNKVVETVTNDADGMITFTQTFDKIGQYPFLIREVKGTDANVTYDTTEYALMVDVKDNLVGQLVATVDFQREAVFENTFTPPVEPTPEPEDDGRIYKSFAFVKVWNDNNNKLGKRPDSITVELYQDGVYVTDVILSKENGWTDTVILMYANGDHVYEWTMKEKNVPAGYVASYNQSEHIVTNTLAELIIGGGNMPTGDDSNLGFFLGAAAVSLIAIIGLIVLMKFRKKDDE